LLAVVVVVAVTAAVQVVMALLAPALMCVLRAAAVVRVP
jgi:hypothetical protein